MTTKLKTGAEQMKSKKLSLLILLFVFVLVFFLGVLFFHCVNPVVKQNQLHSDLLFLDNVTRTCIAEYYKKNIEYPKDLTEIENSIIENCYIGSVPEDSKYWDLLNDFHISSNKSRFIMSWQIQKGKPVYY